MQAHFASLDDGRMELMAKARDKELRKELRKLRRDLPAPPPDGAAGQPPPPAEPFGAFSSAMIACHAAASAATAATDVSDAGFTNAIDQMAEAGFEMLHEERIEYPWRAYFDRPPRWLRSPGPWDWLFVARRC